MGPRRHHQTLNVTTHHSGAWPHFSNTHLCRTCTRTNKVSGAEHALFIWNKWRDCFGQTHCAGFNHFFFYITSITVYRANKKPPSYTQIAGKKNRIITLLQTTGFHKSHSPLSLSLSLFLCVSPTSPSNEFQLANNFPPYPQVTAFSLFFFFVTSFSD